MRVSLVPVAFAGFFLKILSNDSLIPDDRFCENKLIYSKHVVLGVHLFDVFIQFYPLFSSRIQKIAACIGFFCQPTKNLFQNTRQHLMM
jgi:hypothetical protein